MTRSSQTLDPPVGNFYNSDGSWDFRRSDGTAPWYFSAIGDTASAGRDFFFSPTGTTTPFRGSKKRKREVEITKPSKRSRNMPNMFARIRAANARRRANMARRSRSNVRSRTTTRRPTYRRKTYRRKRSYGAPSAARGTTVVLKHLVGGNVNANYLPATTTLTVDNIMNEWFSGYIADVNSALTPIAGAALNTNLVYGRLRVPMSKFIATGGMASQYSKLKVNWISLTFEFPDQSAESNGNSQFPLIFFVNHGDKWKTDIDGAGETGGWTTATKLLDRPGWKKFYVKRMKQFTLKFAPAICSTEERWYTSADQDIKKMKKHDYVNLDARGV